MVEPKLIPKGRLGVSMWVEILLDKYASQRPTERLVAQILAIARVGSVGGHGG